MHLCAPFSAFSICSEENIKEKHPTSYRQFGFLHEYFYAFEFARPQSHPSFPVTNVPRWTCWAARKFAVPQHRARTHFSRPPIIIHGKDVRASWSDMGAFDCDGENNVWSDQDNTMGRKPPSNFRSTLIQSIHSKKTKTKKATRCYSYCIRACRCSLLLVRGIAVSASVCVDLCYPFQDYFPPY
jgi:hypothetical protein